MGTLGKHWKLSEKTKLKMCQPRSDKHRINISISKIGNTNGFKKGEKKLPFTKEHIRKIKEARAKQIIPKGKESKGWGKKQSLETRIKRRESMLNNPNLKFKETSIELKIEAELRNRNINYQKQVRLCGIAIVDFLLPEYGIVIQADGCFYHGCPKHRPQWINRKERDKRQDRILIFNGFKVYRFWEHEINQSAENCINHLALKQLGQGELRAREMVMV